MTTIEWLDHWKQAGIITADQYVTLSALVRKDRFSVFLELNALLYVGVLALVAGIGWTAQTYFNRLGDVFILAVLSSTLAACLYYCFTRGSSYSPERVESPSLLFDYVLYLGCLLLSVELGYLEFRFQVLDNASNYYFLLSTVVFFGLAYRFDNRFVLSLGLSSLAAWFGLTISKFGWIDDEYLRISALLYGSCAITAGTFLYRNGIKKHFLETYLHVATNVIFMAVVSGLWRASGQWVYLLPLILLSTISIVLGVRHGRFAFVAYGTVFGYIGISSELLRAIRDAEMQLAYIIVTGAIIVAMMAVLARRFGRDE